MITPHRARRQRRLRLVFEGRKAALGVLQSEAAYPPDPAQYARAVIKYTRARRAWRAFRGWQ